MDMFCTSGHILRMINQQKFMEIIRDGVNRFGSKAKLAAAVGVSTKAVYDWLNGAVPKLDNVSAVLEKLGVDAEAAGVIPSRSVNLGPAVVQDFLHVPYLNVEVSAGSGLVSYRSGVKSHLAFQASWLHDVGIPDKMVVVQVRGDSMEPLIYDGDVALVDTSQKEVINSRIYAIVLHGVVRIKRLLTGDRAWEEFNDSCDEDELNRDFGPVEVEGHDGEIEHLGGQELRERVWEQEYADLAITSDNFPKYGPEFVEKYYKPGVDFYIVGRAVWIGRDIRRA